MRVVVLVAAALAAASIATAMCPNNCNGHGFCRDDNRCDCFKAPLQVALQRAGWTGHDCSQRMCPFGAAFGALSTTRQGFLGDSGGRAHLIKASPLSVNVLGIAHPIRLGVARDMNVEVEIVEVTGSSEGRMRFRVDGNEGDYEKLHTFSASSHVAVTPASGVEVHTIQRGQQVGSGIVVYVDAVAVTAPTDLNPGDRYFFNFTANDGGSFRTGLHNSMHQPAECSGVGNCDRTLGVCSCPPGFTGAACNKLDCPFKCSGHGVCMSQRTFHGDAGLDYSGAYDADKVLTCKCDAGWRGHDCGLRECPSGPDPLGGPGGAEGRDCSGRGLCDYGTGLCHCAAGFYGIRCEVMTAFV